MPKRKRPESFICLGCQLTVVRLPAPARDLRTHYCNSACKVKAFFRRPRKAKCQRCGVSFETPVGNPYRKYCKDDCSHPIAIRMCLQCGVTHTRSRKTCSPDCTRALRSIISSRPGKKGWKRTKAPRPHHTYNRVCRRCQRAFISKQLTRFLCRSCRRAINPNRDHGKHEARAKRAGVPYVFGIKPTMVFERDGWRCQLCGCSTPERLRGQGKPASPEVDHIIPIAAGGSHTWDNVQCACHACNAKKGDNPQGQLRLAV